MKAPETFEMSETLNRQDEMKHVPTWGSLDRDPRSKPNLLRGLNRYRLYLAHETRRTTTVSIPMWRVIRPPVPAKKVETVIAPMYQKQSGETERDLSIQTATELRDTIEAQGILRYATRHLEAEGIRRFRKQHSAGLP